MIPKIIHYCWFSGDRKPRAIKRCIDSWQRVMPDYKIRCWDSKSFDFDSISFVRDAMVAKKYAFAADYVRLYALYTEGGIYLDSDVLVKRSFNPLLDNIFFCGTEAYMADGSVHYRMEPAIMGATIGHPFMKKCMSFYHNNTFDIEQTAKNFIMPIVVSRIGEEYGYRYVNKLQQLEEMTIYPTSVFTNTLCLDNSNPNSLFAIHQNEGSWIDYSNRGWLYRLCRKHHSMNLYHQIERMRRK